MVRIDCLIFGYRKLHISPEDLSTITSIFLRNSIYSKINSDGTITVRERDILKIQTIISGRVEFDVSEPLGLYGGWLREKNKIMLMISLLISALILVVLSSLVWDIRVDGNSIISDSEIKVLLADSGVEIGNFWRSIDRGETESKMLNLDNRLAWVNINRRGVVAYVEIIEKVNSEYPNDDSKSGYCNIVSNFDCIIEEITVSRGIPMVKPGDAVKAGDILIAGLVSESGLEGFCYAEGNVVGRVNDIISVDISRDYEKIVNYSKKISCIDVNLFKISINIFKLYGKTANEYDIIEKEITYSLLGRSRLPLSVDVDYVSEYGTGWVSYSDDELVIVARERLNMLTAERLTNCDLLKIKTNGRFTDYGYTMSSEIIFNCSVGKSVYFDFG